jgi:putative ABC transport system ATP-binding protein
VTEPKLLLADEPTGNLDTKTTREVMALLQELNDQGVTQLVVTHEDEVSAFCARSIVVRDGRVVEDRRHPQVRVPG